jgi:hypothetical protein
VSLLDLYGQYHDRVRFLMVYIREAHPVDGWWLGGGIVGRVLKRLNPRTATDVHDPRAIEERRAVAGDCEAALEYGIRTYVDEMDDRVSRAYAARPTRLYLVGLDGEVVYAGPPYGFKPAGLGEAIRAYLAAAGSTPAQATGD